MEGTCHCGQVRWRFEGVPRTASACNCSTCRRYGALWGYGYEGETITTAGPTQTYVWNRKWLEFHFCAGCGCVAYWRERGTAPDGRRHMGVNLRLAEPGDVSAIALVHHDTETMVDLPLDGKRVSDVWA